MLEVFIDFNIKDNGKDLTPISDYLCTLERQLDFDLRALWTNPQVNILSCVQYHDIVI